VSSGTSESTSIVLSPDQPLCCDAMAAVSRAPVSASPGGGMVNPGSPATASVSESPRVHTDACADASESAACSDKQSRVSRKYACMPVAERPVASGALVHGKSNQKKLTANGLNKNATEKH